MSNDPRQDPRNWYQPPAQYHAPQPPQQHPAVAAANRGTIATLVTVLFIVLSVCIRTCARAAMHDDPSPTTTPSSQVAP